MSMACNRHTIEQTQLRRQHHVDGMGRPTFDFHTGAYVILYSKDEEQFFKDFSRAFGKLLALGTKQNAGGGGGPLDGLRKLFGL